MMSEIEQLSTSKQVADLNVDQNIASSATAKGHKPTI
jgi:hypothetical protein